MKPATSSHEQPRPQFADDMPRQVIDRAYVPQLYAGRAPSPMDCYGPDEAAPDSVADFSHREHARVSFPALSLSESACQITSLPYSQTTEEAHLVCDDLHISHASALDAYVRALRDGDLEAQACARHLLLQASADALAESEQHQRHRLQIEQQIADAHAACEQYRAARSSDNMALRAQQVSALQATVDQCPPAVTPARPTRRVWTDPPLHCLPPPP